MKEIWRYLNLSTFCLTHKVVEKNWMLQLLASYYSLLLQKLFTTFSTRLLTKFSAFKITIGTLHLTSFGYFLQTLQNQDASYLLFIIWEDGTRVGWSVCTLIEPFLYTIFVVFIRIMHW